ncbi:MAG: citramalate synthase [Pelagibacteraceae bacterium]|jgi:2-isopropylmalate synthase|nr:citramalate synthase [Pelagibacteraceae bacterium]
MSKEKIYIFDTTLRDGAQTEGVNFSIDDKNKIAKALSDLGVDYLEGGWPGANTLDTTFFNNPPELANTNLTAFGMTKKTGRSAENDPGLSALLNTKAPAICLVGKSWDFHVDVALGITKEENLENIKESAKLFVKNKRELIFDAEHFFDGYKKNPEYALSSIKTAYNEGARWIVLCDTNGGTLPHEVGEIVSKVSKQIPGKNLGIHAHNDTENAVANSLSAILAGVRQVQGTINGLGERCGNANLISLIPSIVLKKSFSNSFEIKINKNKIKTLTECSRLLDEILNRKSNRRAAYVGPSAFAHKGGLHVSAVSKDPKTYEHVDPSLVGNVRNIIVSDQAGKSNIMSRLDKYGIKIDKNDPKVQTLLEEVKGREFIGYSYDGADASFELLARRLLGEIPKYLTISKYDVSVKKKSKDKIDSIAKAHIIVDGQEIVCEGSGNGPVNALDNAIRTNVDKVGKYSRYLKDLKLVDYKVRILNTGTNAITRVSIESTDSTGKNWFTIGVSPNIIEASFKALIDSLDYKLYKEKAPANI